MQNFSRLIAVAGVFALSACTSSGEIDGFFQRKATWASFLSGDDIAAACEAGSETHIRFTYNANRAKQVRIYDLVGGGERWELRSRVLEAGMRLRPMTFSEVAALPDPVDKSRQLSEAQAQAILDGFRSARGYEGVPVGDKVFSPSYFWLAASCRDGRFTFDARDHPDRGFADAEFAPFLFDYDPVDIAIEQPKGDKRVTPMSYPALKRERDNFEHYELFIKEDGVVLGRSFPSDRTK